MVLALLAVVPLMAAPQPQPQTITLDPSRLGVRYDGVGALSAGASSRLLIDYPEPQRTHALDYLFSPGVGAALQVIKVEIGGDTQSTDGTEASHMHTRHDLNCTRGFEMWLLHEARRRNPAIVTIGLLWGMPGWVDNQSSVHPEGFNWHHVFGPDMARYLVQFVRCSAGPAASGVPLGWLGIWNESPWGTPAFIKLLRARLDSAGFRSTRLVLMDGGLPPQSDPFWPALRDDTVFRNAFSAVGYHYPCPGKGRSPPMKEYQQIAGPGHALWSSEDFLIDGALWGGAACWATILNANFLSFNMSSTIAWSAVWSVYGPGMFQDEGVNPAAGSRVLQWGPGLLFASTPWSGSFSMTPAAWATAHTTHFTRVGDHYLLAEHNGGSGYLRGGGSYVSFVSPPPPADMAVVGSTPRRLTMVIETADAQYCNQTLDPGGPGDGSRDCANARTLATASQTLVLILRGDLADARQQGTAVQQLRVVRSNRTHTFTELPPLLPSSPMDDGYDIGHANTTSTTTTRYILSGVQPGCIYTITTQYTPTARIDKELVVEGLQSTASDNGGGQLSFPLPFRPNWTASANPTRSNLSLDRPVRAQQYAPFFSDKAGSWALAKRAANGDEADDQGLENQQQQIERLVLRQVMNTRPGGNRWAAHNLDFPLTVVGGVDWTPPLQLKVRLQICAPPDSEADGPPDGVIPSCLERSGYVCALGSSPQRQFQEAWLFRFRITCLQLHYNGSWALAEHTLAPGVHSVRVLSRGQRQLPAPLFSPHSWLNVSIVISASSVTSLAGGERLTTIRLSALESQKGMAGLGSSWSATAFSDFEVEAPTSIDGVESVW